MLQHFNQNVSMLLALLGSDGRSEHVAQGWTGPQILTGVPRQGTEFHPGKILRILALAGAPPARVCRLPGWL